MDKYVKRESASIMFNRYYGMVEKMYQAGECPHKMLQLVSDMKQAFFELPTEDVRHVVRCRDCIHIETTEYGGYCCACDEGVAYNDTCPFGDDGKENE